MHSLCVCLLSSQHFVAALPFLSTVCLFQLRYPVLAPACPVSVYVCVYVYHIKLILNGFFTAHLLALV